MKMCVMCKQLYPQEAAFDSCIALVPHPVSKVVLPCCGTLDEINCLVCLDTNEVEVLGEKQVCHRGHKEEVKP